MYIFHSTVRVKPGKEAAFEAFYHGADPVEHAPGYISRQLLRDKDHPGTYFYIAVWESLDALKACRATETSKAKGLEMNESGVFASPLEIVECALCYDHRIGTPSLTEGGAA